MALKPMVTRFAEPGELERWKPVNDTVMGGCSISEMVLSNAGTGLFRGTISMENRGGFASVRRPVETGQYCDCAGIAVRLRGDGKRYGVNLRTGGEFVGLYYQVQIEPAADEWVELRLLFDDFQPKKHGQSVPDAPPLEPARIEGIGFIISNSQQGDFQLEIEEIRTC